MISIDNPDIYYPQTMTDKQRLFYHEQTVALRRLAHYKPVYSYESFILDGFNTKEYVDQVFNTNEHVIEKYTARYLFDKISVLNVLSIGPANQKLVVQYLFTFVDKNGVHTNIRQDWVYKAAHRLHTDIGRKYPIGYPYYLVKIVEK
jgi:hypothetical protein